MKDEQLQFLKKLALAVYSQDINETQKLAKEYLKKGFDAYEGIVEGMAKGIQKVGKEYESGTMWLPDMMAAANAMKAGTAILMPHITPRNEIGKKEKLKIILGTIEGDVHDIGKNLVNVILSASGYEVIDIGVDVPAENFIEKAKETGANVVGVSALLNTTMTKIPMVIEYAKQVKYRENVKIIIGGAPTSQKFADEIGADGYAADATTAPRVIKEMLGG